MPPPPPPTTSWTTTKKWRTLSPTTVKEKETEEQTKKQEKKLSLALDAAPYRSRHHTHAHHHHLLLLGRDAGGGGGRCSEQRGEGEVLLGLQAGDHVLGLPSDVHREQQDRGDYRRATSQFIHRKYVVADVFHVAVGSANFSGNALESYSEDVLLHLRGRRAQVVPHLTTPPTPLDRAQAPG
ncbi:hypothetical protein ON010_g15349 [Phytophthora cinnamomi]|nr:hypothetical protein ON010_g15349 [Phytophthora cinnamomi]